MFRSILVATGIATLALAPILARATDIPVTEASGKFDHDVVNLKVGDALVITNNDTANHNLSLTDEDAGEAQDMGVQKPGHTLRMSFATAGSFKLRCTLVPDMRMRILVH